MLEGRQFGKQAPQKVSVRAGPRVAPVRVIGPFRKQAQHTWPPQVNGVDRVVVSLGSRCAREAVGLLRHLFLPVVGTSSPEGACCIHLRRHTPLQGGAGDGLGAVLLLPVQLPEQEEQGEVPGGALGSAGEGVAHPCAEELGSEKQGL